MKPFSSEELELLWESVQYHAGSLAYLAQRDPLGQLSPSKEYADQLPKRISQLQLLARKLEERMLQQLPEEDKQ
jgi:hypothetical protein